ncbi:MAG TPA: hemerythrin domain-containing protein [Acidimicrobiales bacterium]
MDAITMLKDDHRNIEKLFKRFEQAGDRAFVEKRKIVDRIIEELSVHAAIEEQLFYPVTRATVPAVEDDALESLEEHHIVKWVLSELEDMDPEDERFDAKVTVLIENVRHHVEDEESEYFREVRDELGRKALTELGDVMAAARETAPTRPHPRMPDTPPGNVVVGAAAGMADRLGATVSGIAQGGVAVAQDVADRVRGRDRTRPSPTGPRRARATATSVRAGSDDAIERVIAAIDEAKTGGERVAGAAVSEAKSRGEKVAGTAARQAKAGGEKIADEARSGAAKTARAAKTPAGKRSSRSS